MHSDVRHRDDVFCGIWQVQSGGCSDHIQSGDLSAGFFDFDSGDFAAVSVVCFLASDGDSTGRYISGGPWCDRQAEESATFIDGLAVDEFTAGATSVVCVAGEYGDAAAICGSGCNFLWGSE